MGFVDTAPIIRTPCVGLANPIGRGKDTSDRDPGIRPRERYATPRAVGSATWIGSWANSMHTCQPLGVGMVPEFSGRAPFVSVMETADLRDSYDPSQFWWLHGPRFRRVLIQREVCSGLVIIRNERLHVPVQRVFVENDHVVLTLAPNRSDHALNV